MSDTYNYDDFKKNGVTLAEVKEVVATFASAWVSMTKSERGNERAMIIAFTYGGRLLEVGAESLPDGCMHYFHASDATTAYRTEYERWSLQ